MRGWQIVGLLLLVFGGALVYLVWQGDQDLQRAFAELQPHRRDAEVALGDCAELIQDLDRKKGTERKKMELGTLRERYGELTRRSEELLEKDAGDHKQRLIELGNLEADFYELKREGEDLRARLREMQSFLAELSPVIQRLGEAQRALVKAQRTSEDFVFQQRAAQLVQKAKVARDLADQGLVKMAGSIVQGRPLGQAALRELNEVVRLMEELIGEETKEQG